MDHTAERGRPRYCAKIKLIDSVPHNMLAKITKECDAFVMPFLINDVVLSVDPVKLYEYISLGKNILCIKYPEVERFADFVYLYEDYDSYKKQLTFMINNQELKYDNLQREIFLDNNMWRSRGEQVIEAISQYL